MVLTDGRRHGYDEYGPVNGKPVLYFHGTPSNRKDWRALGNDGLPGKLGVRGIAADRPGMGLSSFQKRRRISDLPADVAALADALEIEQFAVFGYSGCGPYAIACAQKIPHRLTCAGITAGEGPADQPGMYARNNPQSLNFMKMAHKKPFQFRLKWGLVFVIARYAPRLLVCGGGSFTGLPEADKTVTREQPELGRALLSAMFESIHGGVQGPQWNAALAVSPWDFPINCISVQVHLWQGECDRNVSPASGHFLAKTIPNCHAIFMPGEGHISLVVNHLEPILRALST
jgi:pimeloyl-ACP methyl ester carboxylesterase